VAAIAIEGQRPNRHLDMGTVSFVSRRLESLDLQPTATDVVDGLVTTREQTALDLADRPDFYVSANTSTEALTGLAPRLDWEVLADVARRQRRGPALARIRWIASSVMDDVPGQRPSRRVPSLGLRPVGAGDPESFGILVA
jgi:predicted transcriptional regulator of viral defense system